MSKLVIRDPKGNERTHELVDDITSIGRGSANTIQTKDREASRQHCRIERTPEGYRIVDNRSRNGTTVSGQKVDVRDLRPGDDITIGDFHILFDPPDEGADEDFIGTIGVAPLDEKELAKEGGAPSGGGGKPNYVIEVVEGKDKGKVLELGTEPFTIGRQSSNKYVIDDESASSYHAEVTKEPTGYFVTDLGSTNGTRVGGEKIVKTRLSPGSEIQIGTTKMSFKNVGAPAEEDEIFGTVVLDTERLERELAEDQEAKRAAFVRRIAAAAAVLVACVGLFFLVNFIRGLGGGGGETVEGNMLANASFDGPLSDTGDPSGWRSMAGRFTPWSVLKESDRFPEKVEKGVLLVSREGDAAVDEYTECRVREPVSIEAGKSYKLGGFIRTDGAQGAYGFRARWLPGRGRDLRAEEQTYLTGGQTEWKERSRVFTPPKWASRAEVSCFAVGNRGKIYFDDVYLVPVPLVPAPDLAQAFDRVSVDFSSTGVFTAKSGTEPVASGGELFFVGDQESTSTQGIADAEPPRLEAKASSFEGSVPELGSLKTIRYTERGRPGELGVVIEYKLTSDGALPLERAGVRFTLTGPFAAGTMEVYNDDGIVAGATGRVEGARELVFTDSRGKKFAVHARDEATLRVEPRGDEKLIEVALPAGVTLGRRGTRLGVELNNGSRIERRQVEDLWKAHADAGDDVAAQCKALDDIVALGEGRFPEDVARARDLESKIATRANEDFALSGSLLRKLEANLMSDAAFPEIKGQLDGEVAKLEAKYAGSPFAAKVSDIKVKIAELTERRKNAELEAEAGKLYNSLQGLMKDRNWVMALAICKQLYARYPESQACKKAKDEGMLDTIQREMAGSKARDDAYKRITAKLRNFMINKMYKEALRVLESDPDYIRYKDDPRIKALYEDLKRKLGLL